MKLKWFSNTCVAFIMCFLCLFLAKASNDDRAADAAAIRAHIESIFQAFIDGDEQKIFATHSEDWRGFLEGSRTPIKGIDDYMRSNGIEWPRPANAPKSTPYFPRERRTKSSTSTCTSIAQNSRWQTSLVSSSERTA